MIFRLLFRNMICALAFISATPAAAQTKIAVLSDIHVMSPELLVNDGTAWQNSLAKERKLLDYSQEIFDVMVEKYLSDKPDMLLITGDLTKDGELASHEYVVAGLDRLRQAGIGVYVIPGNHDLGTANALVFDGENTSKAEIVNAATFESLYRHYGYGTSSVRETSTLTYACEPMMGLVLIGIDSGKSGSITETTLTWVCQQAQQAHNEGKQVIAMMHHPLFPHVNGMEKLSSSYNVKSYEDVRNRLVDAGIRIILTGHVHISDIAKDYNLTMTDSIYDVNSGSTISYPCDYRELTLSEDRSQLSIQTGHITSLPSNSDFMNTAKIRFQDFVKNYASSYTTNDMYAQILAAIATLHAEGNENLSSDAQSYLSMYNMIKSSLQSNSTLTNKLNARGLTWEDAETALNSMLKDISSYGVEGREDQTNDLKLTIQMPDINNYSTEIIKGDVDRNGEVNIADAVALVNIILDKVDDYNTNVADIDTNGGININDTVLLVQMILGN